MRGLSAALVVVVAGCGSRAPRFPVFKVSMDLQARVRVKARARPAAPVALVGAAVPEFFGVPLDGAQDVVFVLDRSGSMSQPAQGRIADIRPADYDEAGPPPPPPRKIDVARAELVDALDRLPPGTRMNVLFFNNGLEAFAPAIVELEDSSREGLVGFIRETEPSGATALATAMRLAFLMNARRVILLSDGLGNVGGDAEAVLRDAREAMLGGVRIDTIGLGANQDGPLLDALAAESGGLYQAL